MRGLIIRWLTLTAAIVGASYLIDGIRISGFWSALAAAALLGVLNAVFRPVALLLTLPINILTLGLFTFVVNALMIKMVSGVVPGFDVQGFWTSVIGAFFISVVSWLLNSFIGARGHVSSISHAHRRRDDSAIDLEHKGGGRWE